MAGFRQFTVAEYHRLIDTGVLTEDDNLELIEGYLVLKMSKGPAHESAVRKLNQRLGRLVPPGWVFSCQGPVTLSDSEPEPDFLFARGDEADFEARHPGPAEIGLLVEVSDSSLPYDRAAKTRLFARERVVGYWIVNIPDRWIEVYTDPSGPIADPEYRTRTDFPVGTALPVVLDGVAVGTIAVADVIR